MSNTLVTSDDIRMWAPVGGRFQEDVMRALPSSAEFGAEPRHAGGDVALATVTVLVRPVGRLEGSQSVAFRRRLAMLSVVDGADIAVDLGAVPAMDAAAARSLADAASRATHHRGRLTVRHSRCQPREALRELGVTVTGREPGVDQQ